MKHFVQDDGQYLTFPSNYISFDPPGFNTFRLPVSWQYLVNDVLGGTLDPDNWTKYDALVQTCLALGAYCIVDIHNYAR
jgi:endoglucanase